MLNSICLFQVYFWKANDHFRNAEQFETAKFAISHDLYGIQKGVVYAVRVAGYSDGGEGRKSPTVKKKQAWTD